MKIYEISVTTESGEVKTRELKAESAAHAERLASAKFDGARGVRVGGSREQTDTEREEEARLRARPAVGGEPRSLRPAHADRMRLGILLLAVGLLGSGVTYIGFPGYAGPLYILGIVAALGAVFILWGLTSSSRQRSKQLPSREQRPSRSGRRFE